MASNAVVAPRGSPFLTEMGNLTPAWHHYLAQIEGLTKGLLETTQGAALAEIEAKIIQLEALTEAAEKELTRKNWDFYFTDNPVPSGSTVIVNHDLGTTFVLTRAQQNSDVTYSSQGGQVTSPNSVTVSFNGSVGGPLRGLALGFYGYE